MQISKSLKRLIYWELGIPIALLSIGIYHGLMQTIYRAGVINQSNFAHLDYYQGLTLHGVINAVVLTSFFAVAFGVIIGARRLPSPQIQNQSVPRWEIPATCPTVQGRLHSVHQ